MRGRNRASKSTGRRLPGITVEVQTVGQNTNFEMDWLGELGKDNRGSRPRCVLLTDGDRAQVADRLTRVVGRQEVLFSPYDFWKPIGKSDVREAQVDMHTWEGSELLPKEVGQKMTRWWLANGTRTPYWDIASTCTVFGQKGIFLVEEKAHSKELLIEDNCGAKEPNRNQINAALEEANSGLQKVTGGSWNLSTEHHYQLSNRFAWSWKLAALGIPVVLLYLGFLNADEMQDGGYPFRSVCDWKRKLMNYCSGVVDETCWNKTLCVGGVPFMPLIGVFEQSFEP